jgi:hypothetical protein
MPTLEQCNNVIFIELNVILIVAIVGAPVLQRPDNSTKQFVLLYFEAILQHLYHVSAA